MANEIKSRDMGIRVNPRKGMVVLSINVTEVGAAIDQNVFIADQGYRIVSASEVHAVVGGSSAAIMIRKCEGTEAPSAGQALLTAAFDLTATANTVQNGTLTTTNADRKLVAGDRISFDFSGTVSGLAGAVVTIVLIPDPEKRYWQSIV